MINRYLLDTNTIIYSINGGLELPEASYYTTKITYDEIFSCNKLTEQEKEAIKKIFVNINIIDINDTIAHNAEQIQKKYELTKSDSIICSIAQTYSLTLISNDKILHQVEEINKEFLYFT